MSGPVTVTDTDFEETVLNSELPVLVDFWADWCMPCKMIAPIVEELSQEYEGKVGFAKVDVDSNPKTAMNYGIRSIPTPADIQGRQARRADRGRGAQGRPGKEDRFRPGLAQGRRPGTGSGWGPVALADFKSVVPR